MAETEGRVPYSTEFTWQHPDNGCEMINIQPLIKHNITATGKDISEAVRFVKILAENSPQFCDVCKEQYRLIN